MKLAVDRLDAVRNTDKSGIRIVSLLLFGSISAFAQAGEPVIEAYDGLGIVELDRRGFVTFIYGRMGEDSLDAERFELPDLEQEYGFGILDGQEVVAIGWLQITPIDDSSFSVLLSPSSEYAGSGEQASPPWVVDPYDPAHDDPEEWLEEQVEAFTAERSFSRSLAWTFTVAAAEDENSPDVGKEPRERMRSKEGQSGRGAPSAGVDSSLVRDVADCPGGSCECTRGGQVPCSCKACCPAGKTPKCSCTRQGCRCPCVKAKAIALNLWP